VVAFDPFAPCTDGEVRALQECIHLMLPVAYRECLLWAGHGGGFLLMGERAFYNEFERSHTEAAELLREDGVEPLPPDAFVFYMHDF
jgi:hypothetical protein